MSLSRLAVFGMLICVCAGGSGATTWTVDPSGSCSDSSCTPCCTIQGAVMKSWGGDTISVAPGSYPESIDFRDMASVGDITLEASAGPGTVLVSPSTGWGVYAGGPIGVVTIDGIDFTSPDETCVWLAHDGDCSLLDISANGCGYTAIMLDNTGSSTVERCTANSSARHGIQIDGSSSASVTDCTTDSNAMDGVLVINVAGTVDLTNLSASNNSDHGLDFDISGPLVISGATTTDNTGRGIWVSTSSGVTIENSVVQGSGEVGIDIEWTDSDPVDSVILTGVSVAGNGVAANDSGVRLREIAGPVTVTDCTFDDNGIDGLSAEISVVGDVTIIGGHADGNAYDGYDLRNIGNLTVTGASANGNGDKGFAVDSQATVLFADCDAADNESGAGFIIDWQDPATVDGVTITDCTASNNGLLGDSEGFYLRHVVGPVTITGSDAVTNGAAGFSLRDSEGTVLIRGVTAVSNNGDGVKLDASGGPMTVIDSVVDGNTGSGVAFNSEGADIESVLIARNIVTASGGTGIDLYDLNGPGPFDATCNDVVGNDSGLYLGTVPTVDARHIWWGDVSGPSGQGPGTGDSIWADGGGTILHDPWLVESFTAPISGCPIFESDFEIGSVHEWDAWSP